MRLVDYRLRGLKPGFLSALVLLAPGLALAQPCGTPGREGTNGGVAITGVVNTYYPGTATANAGVTAISVGASSGSATAIAAGDLLLVIQMQDATINSGNNNNYGANAGTGRGQTALNNSGIYEYVVAQGPVTAGSVSILSGGAGGVLLNTYTNAAGAAGQGQRRFQVIRVPQYSSVTLGAGLTALLWNGSVGGVLAIDVSGTLTLGGQTASVNGQGFRGGGGRFLTGDTTGVTDTDYRSLSTDTAHGSKAEGIAGTPRWVAPNNITTTPYPAAIDTAPPAGTDGYPNGSYARGAPGNAGGGGTDDNSTVDNGQNSGGGGGGNGGIGGQGGNTWFTNQPTGGIGGASFAATATRLAMGGGGGAGSANNNNTNDFSHGGRGGGIIQLRMNAASGTGTLSASGLDAPDQQQDGGGGGGAGGSVYAVKCAAGAGDLTGITVSAQGGTGADANWTAGDFHGPGGGGAGGVRFSSSALAGGSVAGAANGVATTATAFGATAGAAGTSNTAATVSSAPGARAGCICIVSQALVSAFRAAPQADGVAVEWETASEAGTTGFYLLRYDASGGEWTRVSQSLVPAGFDSPQGATYRVLDRSAAPSEPQTYALIEVETDGHERFFGPYRVAPDSAGQATPVAAAWERSVKPVEAHAEAAAAPASPFAPGARLAANASSASSASALKLFVRERGVYAVSAPEIAARLGLVQTQVSRWIRSGRVELTSRGQAVAWRSGADGAQLVFVGEPANDVYAPENVYWLRPGRAGLAMDTRLSPAPAPDPGGSFGETLHVEQQKLAAVSIATDPASDYWFWAALIAGDPSLGTQSFALDAPGLTGAGEASLGVTLHGATDTNTKGEHRVSVRLNGVDLGSVAFEGIGTRSARFTFSAGLLQESGNSVELTDTAGPGAPYSIVFLDSFDLRYPRAYLAADGALLARGDLNPVVTIGGFASEDIALFDVTRPERPLAILGASVESSGGAFAVSFTPGRPDRTFLAVETAAARHPRVASWSRPGKSLRSESGARHVVIAPEALREPAERLASHRSSGGLDSRFVPLEQIYDEFADGLATPLAIQAFLDHASRRWQPAPAYVVLAAAGTFDYKDNLGLGGNLVPPLLVATEKGLFAADTLFALGLGRRAPVVGRVPARSASELDAYVDKLIAYEGASAGDWRSRVLLTADDDDEGGAFETESEGIAEVVPGSLSLDRVYLGQLPIATARERLLADLNSGAVLMSYVGHAGLDRLAAEGLLTNADGVALANRERLPVLAALSCVIGRFEVPGITPLASVLVENPNGGAIGVWAPSGLAHSTQTSLLGRALFEGMLQGGASTLGDAVKGAVKSFTNAGGSAAALTTYNLFGDPGLRLRTAN
jgi:hypothetical protein